MSAQTPGSRWWKVDFHTHTPASSDYDAQERAAISERDWLLAYMRAGMDAVMVTDHNSSDWVERLQQVLQALGAENPPPDGYRHLVLFPGIEVTTHDDIHLLAVFAPGTQKAVLDGLLQGRLQWVDSTKPNAERMCTASSSDVIDAIHALRGLVLAAHVEQLKGICHGVVDASGTFQPSFKRSLESVLGKVDGLEVQDRAAPSYLHVADKIKAFAQVVGSDYPHRLANAGRRFTWLKMTRLDFDGLKLAMLDPEQAIRRFDDVSGNPQRQPAWRIEDIVIDHLALHRTQPPLSLRFSPWYSALIGGRGSGKSTIVEALRLALGRDVDLKEFEGSDIVKSFENFHKKYESRDKPGVMLEDTTLTSVVVRDDGVSEERYRYRWTWASKVLQVAQWNGQDWENTDLDTTQARERFPVSIFSQKQIFSLAQRPQALLTYLDKAPAVGKTAWESEFEADKHAFLSTRAKVRELEASLRNRAPLAAELKELERKARVFAQSHYADRLRSYQYEKQQLQRLTDFTDGVRQEVSTLQDSLANERRFKDCELDAWQADRPEEQYIRSLADELLNTISVAYQAIHEQATAMRQAVDTFAEAVKTSPWQSQNAQAEASYTALVAEMRAQGVEGPQQAATVLQRKEAVEKELAILTQKAAELDNARAACKKAYARIIHVRKRLTRKRQTFVEQVIQGAGITNLRITLEPLGDVEGGRDRFWQLLQLQAGTYLNDIWSEPNEQGSSTGLLAGLVHGKAVTPLPKRLYQLKTELEDSTERVLLGLHGKLNTALDKLDGQAWDALWTWFPEDKVLIEHRDRPQGSWRNLELASAGQKTAAILSFLLAHGDEPLVLDQPEDDLDNALIYELVVRQLRDNKARRQLIVVTHNANIVVNGDAELVQPMEVRKGQIETIGGGGLQERHVRERICDVMEGGREAFEQRYKRILKDLEAQR
jgi:energy-coupling factor transporter ATP-binding protein EcfA2